VALAAMIFSSRQRPLNLGRVDAANPYVRGDVLAEPDVNARFDRVAIDDPDDVGLEWTGQDRSAGKRRRSNQYKKQGGDDSHPRKIFRIAR